MFDMNDLVNDEITEILRIRIGVYPLYVHCFGDILSRRLLEKLENSISMNTDYATSESTAMRNPQAGYVKRPTQMRPYFRAIATPFRRRPITGKYDIVFISRYRPMNTGSLEKPKSDYLFDTVISSICRKDSSSKMALLCLGSQGERYADGRVSDFNLFDFFSLQLLLKSALRSFLLNFKYRRIAKRLSKVQREIFSEFFEPLSLLLWHLRDFCLGKALQNLNPKAVVANDDVLVLKPLTDPDTTFIVLQSALITEESERQRHLLFSSFLEDRLLSDFFCVSGPGNESMKRRFLRDTKKIIVTGQPRFDKIAKAGECFDKLTICRRFGLNADAKILLWATETHALTLKENKDNISLVYGAAQSIKNLQLVVKLHPAEDQQAILYRQNPGNVPLIVKGDQNIGELIYVCDAIIIGSASAAGIEAAILGKPIIVLNLSGKPDVMPYVEKGVAIRAHKGDDFVRVTNDTLYSKEVQGKLARARKRFVYDYAYLQDGQASERVAKLIIDQVKRSTIK